LASGWWSFESSLKSSTASTPKPAAALASHNARARALRATTGGIVVSCSVTAAGGTEVGAAELPRARGCAEATPDPSPC